MTVVPSGLIGRRHLSSVRLGGGIIWLLFGLTLLASGCGAVSDRLTATDQTSTIPDGQAISPYANNGTAKIEILDAPPDKSAAPVIADSTGETDGAVQMPTGQEGAASRYTVVAQATGPSVTARTGPDGSAEAVAAFTNPTASGSPLVFRSVQSAGAVSADWIEVHLPIQPNGSTGWIPRSEVALSDNPYRVEVSRADYSLRVFHLNEVWLETPIAIGTGDTPTPVGDFYLLELLAPPDPTGPYGPYAFGLSGFSEVLTSFGGADTAIIGLHGTNDPSSLGTDVSHGCIRLENQVIEQLAVVLPLGTPVRIT